MQTQWGLLNLATDADALVLLVQGKTGSSGANSWNADLCCCWSVADLQITAVNAGTDQLTVTAHGLATGAGPLLVEVSPGGTLPAPLTNTTNYFVNVIDANTVKLATSKANALAGTTIDITTAGSGTIALAPNDSDYLESLVQRVITAGWAVDTKRVFGIGQGGAGDSMLYRFACDHASTIAGVFGFAGAGTQSVEGNDRACSPSQPVHFAHAHGTADVSQEPYNGLTSPNAGMPNRCVDTIATSAPLGTISQLAASFNGCSVSSPTTTIGWADLDPNQAGNETDLLVYTGCPAQGTVEHWRMNGTPHTFTPTVTPTAQWSANIISWINAHGRP